MLGPAQGIPAGQGLLGPNRVDVTIDFSAAAWNTVAGHEVFTVTGMVRATCFYLCTEDLTGGAGAEIAFGREGATGAYNTARVVTGYDVGLYANPAIAGAPTNVLSLEDFVGDPVTLADLIISELDLGYAISVNPATDGTILAVCFWSPISPNGRVVAGTGAAL
jgi:hypothetical protein